MRRLSPVLLAIALAVVATGTPAAADHPTVAQRFAADSGDNCRYGATEGQLEWAAIHPPELPSVAVSGALIDRPVPVETDTRCPDDFFFTSATFSAYTGNVLVDSEVRRVNNGVVSFNLRLMPELSPGPPISRIERVTIQVCRESLVWVGPIPPRYCGRTQTYAPAQITS